MQNRTSRRYRVMLVDEALLGCPKEHNLCHCWSSQATPLCLLRFLAHSKQRCPDQVFDSADFVGEFESPPTTSPISPPEHTTPPTQPVNHPIGKSRLNYYPAPPKPCKSLNIILSIIASNKPDIKIVARGFFCNSFLIISMPENWDLACTGD